MSEASTHTVNPDDPFIFISYAHEDAERVGMLVSYLSREGVQYWMDRSLQSGSSWSLQIQDKLNTAICILGFQSPGSMKSEMCHGEWRHGKATSKLMFVRIAPIDEADVLWEFNGAQYHDWCDFNERSSAATNLVQEIKDRIAKARERAKKGIQPEANNLIAAAHRATVSLAPQIGVGYGAQAREFQVQLAIRAAARAQHPDQPMPPPALSAPAEPHDDETPLDPPAPPIQSGLTDRAWNVADLAPLVDGALKAAGPAALLAAARSGQAEAQALIGFGHLLGRDPLARSPSKAIRWLEKAAAQNFPRAQAELGVLLMSDLAPKADRERARTLLDAAVSAGNARGKALRAIAHFRSVSGITNQQAAALLEAAARAGDPVGASYFGWCHMNGVGVPQNDDKAVEWLRIAAEANEPRAQANLGYMFAFMRGVRLIRNEDADEAAAHWFRLSAERADPWGEFYFAWANENGIGVPRDASLARHWYGRAAEQGDADACLLLAILLIEGRGGPADPTRAAKLLTTAADLGNTRALAMLGTLYEEGRGVGQDLGRAKELYETAARAGDPTALWRLGLMLEWGRGLPKDQERAVGFFKKAAEATHDRAQLQAIRAKLSFYGVS